MLACQSIFGNSIADVVTCNICTSVVISWNLSNNFGSRAFVPPSISNLWNLAHIDAAFFGPIPAENRIFAKSNTHVNFLAQVRLSHTGDGPKVAKRLVYVYFALFKILISNSNGESGKDSKEKHPKASSSKKIKADTPSESHDEMDSQLLTALLTVYPSSNDHHHNGEDLSRGCSRSAFAKVDIKVTPRSHVDEESDKDGKSQLFMLSPKGEFVDLEA
ncbi:OLC1v1013064C1 [Oldenlandia corymbosa var. corymbosa]|uniref:OLC1v1013064C1 n=1 Tax=Oldenlandia corymbosa var. corymbosa TaxID=529605 RepID=A0AAV1DXD2_OLDCO|nr:OLC1v1013064C1 [Oldenlandia corymbosa var. corymbosa]